MTGSRLRPRKWLVGDPVRVKSCPRGGPDQRTRRSVTCPGLAMCLASGRQRTPAGKISSLASPPVHPLVSSRTWVAQQLGLVQPGMKDLILQLSFALIKNHALNQFFYRAKSVQCSAVQKNQNLHDVKTSIRYPSTCKILFEMSITEMLWLKFTTASPQSALSGTKDVLAAAEVQSSVKSSLVRRIR